MFPVGEYRKEEIRQMAERLGLRVAAKRDSQEICFVPDQDHARFVRQRRGAIDTSGEIVTTDGTVVGRHDGFEQFTVGQRKGLRLAFGEPRYVVRIEPDSHRVVIGTHDELARGELTAADANWLVERGRKGESGERRRDLGIVGSPPRFSSSSPLLPRLFARKSRFAIAAAGRRDGGAAAGRCDFTSASTSPVRHRPRPSGRMLPGRSGCGRGMD